MKSQSLIYVSSALGHDISQTEALGSAVWLWMQSPRHRQRAIGELSARLLPAILKDQYILGFEGNTPVFFAAWAWFSKAAETRYVEDPNQLLKDEDWRSGDRFWATDWIAPYGHSIEVANTLKKHPFFADQIVRFFGHRELKSQFMYQLHGRKVSPTDNKRFSLTHPVKPGFIKE